MIFRVPRLPQEEFQLEQTVLEDARVKKGDAIGLLRYFDQAIHSEVEVQLDAECDGVVRWNAKNMSTVRVGDIVAEIA